MQSRLLLVLLLLLASAVPGRVSAQVRPFDQPELERRLARAVPLARECATWADVDLERVLVRAHVRPRGRLAWIFDADIDVSLHTPDLAEIPPVFAGCVRKALTAHLRTGSVGPLFNQYLVPSGGVRAELRVQLTAPAPPPGGQTFEPQQVIRQLKARRAHLRRCTEASPLTLTVRVDPDGRLALDQVEDVSEEVRRCLADRISRVRVLSRPVDRPRVRFTLEG